MNHLLFAMAIDPLSSPPPAGGLAPTPKETDAPLPNELGKAQFLQLLLAQLEFQDPMNPMKDQAFVAQLAQFSALEQQMATNQRLEQVQLAQMALSNTQMAGLIGKEVVASGDTLRLDGGPPPPVALRIEQPASSVKVTIRDSGGRVVARIDRPAMAAGEHRISWDGKGPDGSPLPPGSYTVEVEALDAGGNPVTATPTIRGTITGISFEKGYAEILVGDIPILPADIISLASANNSPPPDEPQPPSNPASLNGG